ncbi:MAG: 23S rRNA (pseudouridine(1915)-N(3))-methyltransferase RlmH [Flavobacteriaceae bacterium]|nr:23S rRNA (pseudouridine(1915)-N(3))-methyltransferase RlmH [Flavobacteriaceae bacterium]MDG2314839.1 23S rRNA (pseudouridine(1915)-N(3))-methyltransferase RlmH [Flavobacteriaceae bacterium]
MKIKLIVVGKTDQQALESLVDEYLKRLRRYVSFEIEIIPDLKNRKSLSQMEQKSKEGALILSKIKPSEALYLLDEKGSKYTSVQFASFIQKKMLSGIKTLVFVIGGPYGFSDEVYQQAVGKISFSSMTFSHQMFRLFVVEQVYRAFTILKNEPYHHS